MSWSPLVLLAGIPILLIGLVGMGPQVNVHRIRPWSVAAWVFRIGGVLMVAGLLASLTGRLDHALVTVSLIMGTACVISCAVIVHHEWVQAGHVGQADFRLQFSPLLMVLWIGTMLGGVIVIIGLAAGWMSTTLQWLIIIEMSIALAFLTGIQSSSERRRAHFVLSQSFSLQAYILGAVILALGLMLMVRSAA